MLDLAKLRQRGQGEPGLLGELVAIFIEQGTADMEELRQAVLRRDAREVERIAHGVKNSASNFAAEPAVGAALRLEIMGRDGRMDGVEQAYSALETELVRLRAALKDLTEDAGP